MEGERSPLNLPKVSGTMYPRVASIHTRPCFSSVTLLRLYASSSPLLVKPRGSQKPTGGCTPSSLSKALSGEAVYNDQSPHADPVRPSWKNMPMIAIIASRPFAISAASFFCFSAGSLEVSSVQPNSPREAGDPGIVWSWEISTYAQYRKIWPQPPTGTLDSAPRPFGTSANLRPAFGDR